MNILDIVGGKKTAKPFTAESLQESSPSTPSTKPSKKRKFTKIDEINEFRNKLSIKVKGQGVPAPATSFDEMQISGGFRNTILTNIEKSDWKEPTPIQMQAIPALLQGRDVLAAAPTGSGKTAAFAIPALSLLSGSTSSSSTQTNQGIKAVILAPTKELAEQIYREVLRLSTGKKIKLYLLNKRIASLANKRQVCE